MRIVCSRLFKAREVGYPLLREGIWVKNTESEVMCLLYEIGTEIPAKYMHQPLSRLKILQL